MPDDAVLNETRANRDLFARVLLTEVETIIEPLRHLDERTRASILVLVGAAQLVTAYERSLNFPNDSIGEGFDTILGSLHEEGAKMLSGLRTAGLAESLAYAWTLARSRAEQGEEAETKAARAAAAEIACAMSHLDALMDVLRYLGLPARLPQQRRRIGRIRD
jgi:hypothetical protein